MEWIKNFNTNSTSFPNAFLGILGVHKIDAHLRGTYESLAEPYGPLALSRVRLPASSSGCQYPDFGDECLRAQIRLARVIRLES